MTSVALVARGQVVEADPERLELAELPLEIAEATGHLLRMRLVAATAAPGLQPSAPPTIEQIPNNHRSYAVQWFLVAALAAAIYLLALRKRLHPSEDKS